MEIGQAIKKLREEKGFKQKELSDSCNITQTYLSLIENGKKKPNVNLIENIGKNLGIPIQVILFQSLTENDVDDSKKEIFRLMSPTINEFIRTVFIK
ncbi:MAG: helix-turn-helix transcriptional regulator [Candidatus Marinimicrobia bacterium]|nr:helix-turn-helix transcriptional regulator [Candidatus Neomarinimicrobiota bacterium]